MITKPFLDDWSLVMFIELMTKGDQTPEHVNIMFTNIINLEKGGHLADIRMERCF
jgi:hypothetical protein